jgi:hypothetical protein
MMQADTHLIAAAEKIYNLLLYTYPARFRREFGTEMVQVFRDDMRATLINSGKAAFLGLWLLTFFDLLKTVLAEHIWEVFHMPMGKLARWSGLAAAIGFPLFTASFGSHIFWQFVGLLGLIDNKFTHPLLAEFGLLLTAIGLAGLYRHLPQNPRPAREIAFGVTLFGVLLMMIATLGLILPVPEFLPVGLLFFLVGFAAMGILTLLGKSLGTLSFAPFLAIVSLALFVLTINASEFAGQGFLFIHLLSWVLIGYVLWTEPELTPVPMFPA